MNDEPNAQDAYIADTVCPEAIYDALLNFAEEDDDPGIDDSDRRDLALIEAHTAFREASLPTSATRDRGQIGCFQL